MQEILDNIEKIKEIDNSDMLTKAFSLPEMLEEGWQLCQSSRIAGFENAQNIVIAGMGGSAISGDIINCLFSESLKIPVFVNRSYSVPAYLSNYTLFIAVSYSGNTEETLSAIDKAIKKGCMIITISSGGKLESLSKELKIGHLKVPGGLPPRAALGYILSALLYIFDSLKLSADIKNELLESISMLKKIRVKYSAEEPLKNNEAKQMAKKMQNKIPIIISSIDTTYPVGLRFKTQLNENSKATALHIAFPELNHNDLVNFSFLKPSEHNYIAVVMRDNFDSERMKKRIEITKSLISGDLAGFNEVWSQGKTKLARILSLIMYNDMVSVYLAVLHGYDPTPVLIIEQLKKELLR